MSEPRLETAEEHAFAYSHWCPCPFEPHLCAVACCSKCAGLPKRSTDEPEWQAHLTVAVSRLARSHAVQPEATPPGATAPTDPRQRKADAFEPPSPAAAPLSAEGAALDAMLDDLESAGACGTRRCSTARYALKAAFEALQAEIAKLRAERDLAVAHDRQPYPTAEAYEKACHARNSRAERAEARANAAEADLDLERSNLRAILSMTVGRLGGEVEGAPTARHNFLQRIDALRAAESSLSRAREALEWIERNEPGGIAIVARALSTTSVTRD